MLDIFDMKYDEGRYRGDPNHRDLDICLISKNTFNLLFVDINYNNNRLLFRKGIPI